MSDLVWLIKIDVGFVTLGILKWELHYHILRQLKGGGGGWNPNCFETTDGLTLPHF